MAKTAVQLSDGFPKGTKASLSILAGSVVQPGGAQKTTTADGDGVISFPGCDVGAQYVIKVEGDGWTAQYVVQAKDETFSEDANLHRDGPEATGRRLQADREAQAEARREAEKTDPLVASPAPGGTVVDNRPTKGTGVRRPQPAPRQRDHHSGPQRSDTPDGEATPIPSGEPPKKPAAKRTRRPKTTGAAKRANTTKK